MIDLSAYFHYLPSFYSADKAEILMAQLQACTDWQQPQIQLFGRRHKIPRLTAWVADAGLSYRYSGIKNLRNPWTPSLQKIKADIEAAAGCEFNSLLLNYYRDGSDSNGWHADNEPELCALQPIASLSLGASRRFRMRETALHSNNAALELASGSLLVMAPGAQAISQHCLPKTQRPVGPRINLTFRCIKTKI